MTGGAGQQIQTAGRHHKLDFQRKHNFSGGYQKDVRISFIYLLSRISDLKVYKCQSYKTQWLSLFSPFSVCLALCVFVCVCLSDYQSVYLYVDRIHNGCQYVSK